MFKIFAPLKNNSMAEETTPQTTQAETPLNINNQPYVVGQIQHFKELSSGAGDTIWKVNSEGQFMGANNYTAAPFKVSYLGALTATGATVTGTVNATGGTFSGDVTVSGSMIVGNSASYHTKLNGSNGRIELKNGSTVQSGIYNDASAKLTLDTNDSIVFRRHSGTLPGTGYLTFNYNAGRACMDIEVANQCRIESSAGREIRFESSQIEFNGDIAPTSDNAYKCGTSGQRWSVGYFEDVVVDDLTVNSGCSGCSYIELNLLQESEKEELFKDTNEGNPERKTKSYTGFEVGDVLVWKNGKLEKSSMDTCPCVTAVSSNVGTPIVLGAEKIKVVGKVKENQFLVTSPVPGYARAWNEKTNGHPPMGTVIAQSMENKLTNEPGTIMAMIRKF